MRRASWPGMRSSVSCLRPRRSRVRKRKVFSAPMPAAFTSMQLSSRRRAGSRVARRLSYAAAVATSMLSISVRASSPSKTDVLPFDDMPGPAYCSGQTLLDHPSDDQPIEQHAG
jgi:hypothetical protein